MVKLQILNIYVFLLILLFQGCFKFTPSKDELDQPYGFTIFNYLINNIFITTEGWNVVTLSKVESNNGLNSIFYSKNKLYLGGEVNYLIDLDKGERIPWINGDTINSIKSSNNGFYILSKKYLMMEGETSRLFCPKPSDLTLQNYGYIQKGDKIVSGESGDVYIGFKNNINEQQYSLDSTATYDCSIYKYNPGTNPSQNYCSSSVTSPMTLFAGNPGSCFYKDGTLTSSYFRDIVDLIYDNEKKKIYVCESQAIRQIDLNTNQVSTILGSNNLNITILDGDLSIARMVRIGGCFYKDNTIFFTDRNSVRRINFLTGKVSTLADGRSWNGLTYPKDGKGGAAIIAQPGAITGDVEGNLYILDRENFFDNPCGSRTQNLIRKISPPDIPVTNQLIASNGKSIPDRTVCFTPQSTFLYQDGFQIINQTIFRMTTPVGTSLTKTFEIKNQGQAYESFATMPIRNNLTQPGIFTIGDISPNVIPPGGSGFFTITYSPILPFGDFLSLTLNEYASQYGSIFFNIQGTVQ